jgi:Ala-tRNA(Pro) deacylase
MPTLQTLKSHLDTQRIPYEIIHHRRDFTAPETAAHTHTPGKAFAKTVIVEADRKFYMFVMAASDHLDLEKVRRGLRAKEVHLASESEVARVCPDCEIGAMPPFGKFYQMPVYVSHRLIEDQMITFNAGTHEEVIRMLYQDYAKLAQPAVMNFTIDH